MPLELAILIFGILTAILGFFLVKFYGVVEAIEKDVKQLLIEGSSRNEMIKNVMEDVEGLTDRVVEHDKSLQRVEQDVALIKQKIIVQ